MWDVAAFSVFSQSAREAMEEDSNFVTVVANFTTDGLLVYCRFLAFFQLNLKNNLSYSAAAAVWWYPNIIHNTTKNNKYRLTDQVYIFVSPQNKVLMPLFTTTKTTTLHLTISINAPLQPLLHDLTDVCIDTQRRRNIFESSLKYFVLVLPIIISVFLMTDYDWSADECLEIVID